MIPALLTVHLMLMISCITEFMLMTYHINWLPLVSTSRCLDLHSRFCVYDYCDSTGYSIILVCMLAILVLLLGSKC